LGLGGGGVFVAGIRYMVWASWSGRCRRIWFSEGYLKSLVRQAAKAFSSNGKFIMIWSTFFISILC